MNIPIADPKGFDRTKALPIEQTGEEPNAVYKVYNTKGKLLGAFSDKTMSETFRDTLPLEKVFLM